MPPDPLHLEGALSGLCDVIVYESRVTRAEPETESERGADSEVRGRGKSLKHRL